MLRLFIYFIYVFIVFVSKLIFHEIKFSDIIGLLSLLAATYGYYHAYVQWKASQKIKRADFLSTIMDKLRNDEEIRRISNMIDYDKKWFNSHFFYTKKLQFAVDKTISYYSYICYLLNNNIITSNEFDTISYPIKRALSNYYVQDYLYNLYHFTKSKGLDISFKDFLNYDFSMNFFDDEFKNPKAYKSTKKNKYHKYLNF